MKIITWNLRWGGEDRITRIATAIRAHSPDIAILTEYQPEGSASLLTALAAAGWVHQITSTPPPRRGGVAIISKTALAKRDCPATLTSFDFRYLSACVPAAGLEIRAIYAPLHREPYGEFWAAVLDALASERHEAVLAIGDFNSGESQVDAPVPDFLASEFFTQLPQRGYTDLWRHGRARTHNEPTWLGPVNPYRLDHAFGTADVLRRLDGCTYDHTLREAGHSDHSLLSVHLSGAAV